MTQRVGFSSVLVALFAALLIMLLAFAPAAMAGNPNGTGQPDVECEDFSDSPAGFETEGFANAEEHYAGNGASADHAQSEHAVSQYDVACYHFSNRGSGELR